MRIFNDNLEYKARERDLKKDELIFGFFFIFLSLKNIGQRASSRSVLFQEISTELKLLITNVNSKRKNEIN